MFPQSFDFVCSDPRRMGQRHGEMLRYAARDDTLAMNAPRSGRCVSAIACVASVGLTLLSGCSADP